MGWGCGGKGVERGALGPAAWSVLKGVALKLAFFSLQNDKITVGTFTACISDIFESPTSSQSTIAWERLCVWSGLGDTNEPG